MKLSTIIFAILVIILVPLFFLSGDLFKSFGDSEPVTFRGQSIRTIEPEIGTVQIPAAADIKKGTMLQASMNASFVEKLTGVKLASADGLSLQIEKIDTRSTACAADPAKPSRASFENQSICAAEEFNRYENPNKTALYVEPAAQLIVFGDSKGSFNKVFNDGWFATYNAPPMTRGDQKRLACQVSVAMDYLLEREKSPPLSCSKTAN